MEDKAKVKQDTHDIQPYRVRSYECGPDGFALFSHLCNYLQETASVHAEKLGFSKRNFDHLNISWVLTRMHVHLVDYPRWSEDVVVLTFPHGMRKFMAYRDFVISRPDGTPIGVATSEWTTIDLQTRRVSRIPEIVASCSNTVRTPVWKGEPFSKLRFEPSGADMIEKRFPVQRSHIDLNGHVNNVRYLEWMMECAPEAGSGRRVSDMEVVFRSEAMHGDTVVAQCTPCPDGSRAHQVTTSDGRALIIARTEWMEF